MDTRTINLVLCFLFIGLMAQAQRTEIRLKRVEQAPRPGAIILAEADSLAAWNDTLYWDGTVLWLDSARTITLPYLQDSILSGYADTTYAQSLVISTSLIQDSILTYIQNNAEIGRDTVRITWGNLPGIPPDIADGDDNTQLTPAQVVGIARDTGFIERFELADTSSVLRTYTNQAEADAKAYADANDDIDDADADPTNELQNWGNLPGIPLDIADGDDNTQLSPAQVVGIARDTGFLESIVAGYGLQDVGIINPELELDFSELGDSPTADGDADIVLYLPTGDVAAKTDLQNALNNTLTSSDNSVTITEVGANQINLQAAGGSGSNDWNDLINVPAGFSDDIDDVSVETWSTLSGIPAGFADGIDDVGASAEGTLYASITGTNDAVVSMASYTDSADVRWHFANDTLLLNTWYMGLDGSDGKAFKWAWNSNDFSSPALNIETNGNIGVGTTTPVEKLHVDGGNIRMATASTGTNRIIYDSDGLGTMEWTTPASIGINDTQLSNEQVQDIIGAMVSGNTETDISVTYQDGDGTLDFVVSGGGGTGDIEGVTAGTGLGGGGVSGTVTLNTAFEELPVVGLANSVLDVENDYFVMRTSRDETGDTPDTDARVPMRDAISTTLYAGTNITFSNRFDGRLEINSSGGIGDITSVTAGDHLTGGGTSGSVTLNVDAESAYASTIHEVQLNSDSDQRFAFVSNNYRQIWYTVYAFNNDVTIDIPDPDFAPEGAIMVFALYRDKFTLNSTLTLDVDGTDGDLHIAENDTFSTGNFATIDNMSVLTLRRMRAPTTSGYVWIGNFATQTN